MSHPNQTRRRTRRGSGIETKYRGFSCPQEQLDQSLLEAVVVEFAREMTHRFVEKYRAEVARGRASLGDFILSWTESEANYETAWSLEFGEVSKMVLTHDPGDLHLHAAALGLRLAECGQSGEWSFSLGCRSRLRWGRWLLPEWDGISLASDGTEAELQLSLGADRLSLALSRDAEGWNAPGAEGLNYFGSSAHRIIILPRHAIAIASFRELWPMVADGLDADMARTGARALDLLDRHAPVYRVWVERVIRHVIPLHFEKSFISSGSEAGQPGVIHMRYYPNAMATAEILVHEATHQYMHILCRLGDIDDGSDRRLYYSPIRQAERPLWAIVIAYHAFANVLLLYRLCRESGIEDDGYCTKQESLLLPQLRELQRILANNHALTDVGRGLVEPLTERIG